MTTTLTSIGSLNGAKPRDEVDIALELIGPELATHYLTFNTHNRNPKWPRINCYAEDMRSGNWLVNGEAIKFSKSGELIDGQNRLYAIIEAGVSVKILVVRGLDNSTQETMDGGVVRSLADILKLRGEKCVNTLVSVIRALYFWDNAPDPSKRVLSGTGTKFAVPNSKILDYFSQNDDRIRELSHKCDQLRVKLSMSASVIAPLLRESQDIDPDDSMDFWTRLVDSAESPKAYGAQDPLAQLRKSLDRLYSKDKYQTVNSTEIAALIVKTWNAYRDGLPVAQLRWRSGGNAPEAFPAMK
jgi:hypothetical protein